MGERQLGQYTLLDLLGAGGMGEVYRAVDRRLEREVALKLLPEELTKDGKRLARLEREARLLASLNHPNIATIFEIGSSDERAFLALELVPGETLAQFLRRGPLRLDDALVFFRQLAEALDAAHERGIVHRDLKPANLQITPEGTLKVLDFGLAKGPVGQLGSTDLSRLPTVSDESIPGRLLGTLPYMSPEQARGQTVDKRTDIWAFGCCLFEALSGRRAFEGGTASDTLANILRGAPDWSQLPTSTPERVLRLLRRCLEKDPRRRQRDIGDVWLELSEHEPAGMTRRWLGRPRRLAVGLMALAVLLTALLLVALPRSRQRVASWLGVGPPKSQAIDQQSSAATPPHSTAPPARREVDAKIRSNDAVITLEVDVDDLIRSLDSSGKLDELDVDDKSIVFVVPRDP